MEPIKNEVETGAGAQFRGDEVTTGMGFEPMGRGDEPGRPSHFVGLWGIGNEGGQFSVVTLKHGSQKLGQLRIGHCAAAKGTIPIGISRPLDIGKRVVDAIDGERSPIDPVMNAVPALKQTVRGVRNVSGMLDTDFTNDVNGVTEYLLRSKSQFKKDQDG